MYRIAVFLAIFMVAICSFADAALKYQQDVSFMSWKSQEDVEEMVREFCDAAEGDVDIKIIGVKYKQKKSRKMITYNATITCHVSEIDKDLMRINGKVFQQKHGLISDADSSDN